MPIFGYECPNEKCPDFDVLCKFDDKENKPCPRCLCPYTKRKLSAPNFNMKQGPYDSYL